MSSSHTERTPPASPGADAAAGAGLVDVLMPAMGTSITEATVVGWRKQIGDQIAADETICEISSDKVDTECPAPASGTLVEIVVAPGETVDVGTVIARIATEQPVAAGGVAASGPSQGSAAQQSQGAAAQSSGTVGPAADELQPRNHAPRHNGAQQRNGAHRLSPVVARMLAGHQLDASTIAGTGRGGRITKKDVLAALEHAPAPPAPAQGAVAAVVSVSAPGQVGGVQGQPSAVPSKLGGTPDQLSRMRQTIGARMRASQQTAATCHTLIECDMTAVEARRHELGITALPLVAAATVATLREFPELNATLDGTTITHYTRMHLGIAVSLGDQGLIVPVIHDAQNLSPQGLSTCIRELGARARAGQLLADEVQGATFTITNPGSYGSIAATPVIDLPQVAILDLEAIVRRPVVITLDGQESIGIRSMVNLILGWDHRAVDGAYAAQFLAALRRRLEHPEL